MASKGIAERMAADSRSEAHAIIAEMIQLKSRLAKIGMYRTMQALDGATQAFGYELADILQESPTS